MFGSMQREQVILWEEERDCDQCISKREGERARSKERKAQQTTCLQECSELIVFMLLLLLISRRVIAP